MRENRLKCKRTMREYEKRRKKIKSNKRKQHPLDLLFVGLVGFCQMLMPDPTALWCRPLRVAALPGPGQPDEALWAEPRGDGQASLARRLGCLASRLHLSQLRSLPTKLGPECCLLPGRMAHLARIEGGACILWEGWQVLSVQCLSSAWVTVQPLSPPQGGWDEKGNPETTPSPASRSTLYSHGFSTPGACAQDPTRPRCTGADFHPRAGPQVGEGRRLFT